MLSRCGNARLCRGCFTDTTGLAAGAAIERVLASCMVPPAAGNGIGPGPLEAADPQEPMLLAMELPLEQAESQLSIDVSDSVRFIDNPTVDFATGN